MTGIQQQEAGSQGAARARRRWKPFVVRGLMAAGLFLVFFVAGITFIGIPPLLSGPLLASVNRGDWFFEVSRLTLDPGGGIVAHGARIYRKGVAGPPVSEARRIHVRFSLLGLARSGRSRVREVVVEHGLVRSWSKLPLSLSAKRKAGGGKAKAADPDPLQGLDLILHLRDVAVLDVPVQEARMRLTGNHGDFRISNAHISFGDETVLGDLEGECTRHEDGRWTGRIASRVDPRLLMPVLGEIGVDLSDVLDRFSFHADPPSIDLVFDLPAEEGPVEVKGRFQSSEFAYLGAAIGFANITWQCQWGGEQKQLVLNPLVLVSRGRTLSGRVTVDLARQWLDGEIASMLDLNTIVRIAGVPRDRVPESWRFGEALKLHAKGRFAYGDPADSDLEATAEGRDLKIDRFPFDELSLRLTVKGLRHELADVRGRFAGGSMNGWASIGPEPGYSAGRHYQLRCEILNAELGRLLEMAGSRHDGAMEGRVYGTVDLEWAAGEGVPPGRMKGSGGVSIAGGRLFSLPLFGGLTRALASRFDGIDTLVAQREARATYTISEGRISSKDVRIEGDFFSVEGDGECTLDGKLDFSVKVRPATERRGIGAMVRALTAPLSKLLEFRLEGTLSNPQWKSTALSISSWFENGSRREKK